MVVVVLCCLTTNAQTQETPKPPTKMEAGFEGMIGLSASDRLLALNVGGPSLKYKLNASYKIGIGAFPSLLLFEDKVFPRLAFSPLVEHKNGCLMRPIMAMI